MTARPGSSHERGRRSDIVQYAWTKADCVRPVVLVAMAVGIGSALVQALTQIQEIADFRTKIVAIMLVAPNGPVYRQPDIGVHERHPRAHPKRIQ